MRALRWVIDTAGSITGTRFRLVIASSSTATALIIGSSLASGGDSGLASQLQQALGAPGGGSSRPPAAATPALTPGAACINPGRRDAVEGRSCGPGLIAARECTDRCADQPGQDAEDNHTEG